MRYKILSFFKVYTFWILIFIIQKPIFMLRYNNLMGNIQPTDWLAVIWHGLPLDLSMAAYLTVIPALLLIASLYINKVWIKRIYKIYTLIAAIFVASTFIVNLALYYFWGFPLDSTPLFYFLSSPTDALASVSIWFILLATLAFAISIFIITWCANRLLFTKNNPQSNTKYQLITLIILTAALFIPIRGGFSVATMNTGKAYFSANQPLNHAAINPAFSFMEAVLNQKNLASQYRFMPEADANKLFKSLIYTKLDTTHTILNTLKPNILLIIMESFSNKVMSEKNVTPQLNSIANNGILFTNFYANSFRTDRALVSILSGYPAQPTTSIMQYPHKTTNLPSISKSLIDEGYTSHYYYGGDADFTNMRSYLVSSGFSNIVADTDFPIKQRLSKWGVPDEYVFDRLLNDLRHEKTSKNMFRVLQTSSSHEPFDVPYHRLNNKILNAFAYTDHCIGNFINQFRKMSQWKNTLVIILPDHLGAYPHGISNFNLDRYRIPLILTGGAITGQQRIATIASQQDIAATLLAQLGITHDQFTFSKDILDPRAPHFAFFTVPDAFGMITKSNALIYDNASGRTVLDTGKAKKNNLNNGKAYLQKLYDDIGKR